MDVRAYKALERLLAAGEKHGAGVRTRQPALTQAALADYRTLTVLRDKEAFEASILDARARRIVAVHWDSHPPDGFIDRVDLLDAPSLARFLGKVPVAEMLTQAIDALTPSLLQFPVLNDVLQRWALLRKVRGCGPADALDWQDAIRLIAYARTENAGARNPDGLAVRVASARLFKNSKRIEALTGPITVLLAGAIDTETRAATDLWAELGLVREEQPVRLAGYVDIARSRVTGLLDAPYAGYAATAILGLAGHPKLIMSIENLTTFHLEAEARCDEEGLLLYSAGTPTPAWHAMYGRLLQRLPATTPVLHWGDVDEGGYRIAAQIAATARQHGHTLQPWRMHPNDVPSSLRRPATAGTIARMQRFARETAWYEIAEAIGESKFTVEQESLAEDVD